MCATAISGYAVWPVTIFRKNRSAVRDSPHELSGAPGSRAAASLMPLPVKVKPPRAKLAIDGSFSVAATAYTDLRLESALNRFAARVLRQTAFPCSLPALRGRAATLQVECAGAPSGPGAEYPSLGEDESYRLDVAPTARTSKPPPLRRARHGLETFAQLVVSGAQSFQVAAFNIQVQSRSTVARLMLDVCATGARRGGRDRLNLDRHGRRQAQRLHWHLSDDSGFSRARAGASRASATRVRTAISTRRRRSVSGGLCQRPRHPRGPRIRYTGPNH